MAELCGVDLAGAPATQRAVGGADGPGLVLRPWLPSFGLTGFFDQCEVTISYEERIELKPVSS